MNAQVRAMARKFVGLWRRERELNEAKRELGQVLIQRLKAAGEVEVDCGGCAVQLIESAQKRPGRGDIETFFGAEEVAAFWDQLESKVSEYLTVILPKGV